MAGRRVPTLVMIVLITMVGTMLASCGFLGSDDSKPKGVTAPQESKLDLAYASASPAQSLDLLLPKRTGEAIPLVIAIHGGGWQLGDKHDLDALVAPLQAQGYAMASINYRLSDVATFPAAILDAKAAVRWLRAHAAEYGLDPGRFAVWGFSAGANLAALIGMTGSTSDAGMPTFNDRSLGNPDASAAVQAVVDFYGPTDLLNMDRQFAEDRHCSTGHPAQHDAQGSAESLYLGGQLPTQPRKAEDASPMHYVGTAKAIPPFFIAHGQADCVVPDRQSTEFAQALRQKGIRAELTIVPGFGHGDPQFDREQAVPAISFLNSVIGSRDGQDN